LPTNIEILDEIKARLPRMTQRVIGVLGWEASLRFLRLNGTRYCYVPEHYHENLGRLFNGLTEIQSRALIEEFGGEDIKWPSHRKLLSSERYQLILNDVNRNMDLGMIAEKFNCSKPEVVRIIQHFGVKPKK